MMVRDGVRLLLQMPVLEYVSRYVPEEYDSSFEDVDTWIDAMSDLTRRHPEGSFELGTVEKRSLEVFEEDPLSPGSHQAGTLPLVVTDFRKEGRDRGPNNTDPGPLCEGKTTPSSPCPHTR